MGTTEGGPKASGLAGNPRGGCHGVGGGVELLQGINTPGVEELPQGDKTSGVPTEGDGVLGEDGREWVGDGNPPTTRATEAGRASSSDEGMTIRPAKEVPPSPQQCTTVDRDLAGTLHRHSNGAENARPKNGMQLRPKCSLLVP